MGKLSSAIVQRKLASLRDVEEALARQVLYGGDLATNLLEQAPAMDERALVALLAETHELPAAPAGELPRSPSETRLLVPGDVALRHGLYPLDHSEGALVVAVAEPLKAEVEQDLGFGLGVTLSQRVAPLVRIRQAVCRDYGLTLDRRSLRVLAKLQGAPDPSPSVAPAPLAFAPDLRSLPRPPSIPPLGLPAPMDMSPMYGAPREARPATPPPPSAMPAVALSPLSDPSPITLPEGRLETPSITEAAVAEGVSIHERLTSPAPAVAPRIEDETRPWNFTAPALPTNTAAAPAPPPAPMSSRSSGLHAIPQGLAAWSADSKETEKRHTRARRRGPYTTAAAEQDLLDAEGRDDVLNAFFRFVCQYFEYSALFAVHGDLAEGRDASGPGADHATITGIGVPLDLPSSLRTAKEERRFVVESLAEEGLDARFAKDLLRKTGKRVLLMPIVVRERCVLLFYGDDGDTDVELSHLGDVLAFAPLVATALESVILRKKTAVRNAVGGAEGDRPPVSLKPSVRQRPVLPTKGERVEALTEALQGTVRPISRPPLPPPKVAAKAEDRAPTPAQGTPRHASVPPPPMAPVEKAEPTRPSLPIPRPTLRSEPPRSPRGAADATPVSVPRPYSAEGIPVFPLSRRSSIPPAPTEDAATSATQPNLPLDRASAASDPDEGPEISVGMAEVDWSPDHVEHEPDSQVVVATQLPIKRYPSEEQRLPSVILNVDGDLQELVERLVGGDEKAIERVAAHGATAASLLVAHFPGPIKQDSDRLGAPEPASHRGPLLRALARIGQSAVPFVVVRSADRDSGVRVLATLLLGELPSEDSAHAVARRVTDSAAEVRRAALEAGRMLQSDKDARTALRDKILTIAEDKSADVESRVAAIEALAHIRDTRGVPRLVRLVPSNDEVGQSAQWALGVITRQAFGRDIAAWDVWWSDHESEHRIVWLIDALMHDDPEIRRAAGEELKALTKEYFGYYDDLSKREREKAQKRYRDWWEQTGKARFDG